MKADLHVHSRFSTRPSQWILQKIGCPESFTDPAEVHRIAKAHGMDLVTVTDHNTIRGALEIAHLPDVFISEEITTYFPEDGCKVHVLAYDISEDQHQDIQKVRENIYELVSYLNEQKILHAVAHPLYGINDKLTVEHFEKMLLLFDIFELNGARSGFQNQVLRAVLERLDQDHLVHLAETHKIVPKSTDPGQKAVIAGSDDHSSLNIARSWTQVPQARDVRSFLTGVGDGTAQTGGIPATPLTMAHNLYAIAYQYYRQRFRLDRHIHKDVLFRFLEKVLDANQGETSASWSSRVYDLARAARRRWRNSTPEEDLSPLKAFWKTSRHLVTKDARFAAVVHTSRNPSSTEAEKIWHQFVGQAADSLLVHLVDRAGRHLRGANLFDTFGSLGSAGALYSLLAPYFVAYAHFTKDKVLAGELSWRHHLPMEAESSDGKISIAHFSDTLRDVNGVAQTLLQQLHTARRLGHRLMLFTAEETDRGVPEGVLNFRPVGRYQLPEYPELSLNIPPFLQILATCHEQGFTQIHSATPGPMGLAALAAARILSLPIAATYHTAFPQYVKHLTGDETLEAATWRYMIWYYRQMDRIYVPSVATARELICHGLPREKIRTYPRGVDTERFHPRNASERFRLEHGLDGKTAVLYVGRVSKEKELDLLCRAYRRLLDTHPDMALVVVGDGPYREQMEGSLRGTPAVFTGYLSGENLTEAYASCDFFVFPSTTDTFGNVVLEAQASGLPVVVSDQGGPQENLEKGRTGLIFRGGDEDSLLQALAWMATHPIERRRMSREARALMEKRSFKEAFLATWHLYGESFDADEDDKTLREAV
ncbi:Glycosyltransferase involved in cell wall bisynthesis [Desulfacinum hydrothermale DSM 13146]|uniref:Glycosyltransferase involved in cell wall bisynthesis n=1 Tax=Desulfacinum hydrothermale DSM 13146 TaxID=1121390 RepID=A0A1W1XI86_9BACT|nr:glycosyltransferase [Desulfacinum hydrothermale]SMC23679.1 Glycosyltransferase involved in cell wall bisynthesis [Desulfacinum hydrothermale DSM 13146]